MRAPTRRQVKMLPGCDVTGHVRTVSIRKKDVDSAEKTSLLVLARTLLAIDGVTSLLFGYDFVTVVKDPCMEWEPIQVLSTWFTDRSSSVIKAARPASRLFKNT